MSLSSISSSDAFSSHVLLVRKLAEMTTKTATARHTLEFKQEAVRLVENGQSIAAARGAHLE